MIVQEGDAVTVVIGRSLAGPILEETVVRKLVARGNWDGSSGFCVTGGELVLDYRHSEEGVWWIRGHHDACAHEVLALRAAFALAVGL